MAWWTCLDRWMYCCIVWANGRQGLVDFCQCLGGANEGMLRLVKQESIYAVSKAAELEPCSAEKRRSGRLPVDMYPPCISRHIITLRVLCSATGHSLLSVPGSHAASGMFVAMAARGSRADSIGPRSDASTHCRANQMRGRAHARFCTVCLPAIVFLFVAVGILCVSGQGHVEAVSPLVRCSCALVAQALACKPSQRI